MCAQRRGDSKANDEEEEEEREKGSGHVKLCFFSLGSYGHGSGMSVWRRDSIIPRREEDEK